MLTFRRYAYVRTGVFGKSLHDPSTFAVNLRLLQKLSLKKKVVKLCRATHCLYALQGKNRLLHTCGEFTLISTLAAFKYLIPLQSLEKTEYRRKCNNKLGVNRMSFHFSFLLSCCRAACADSSWGSQLYPPQQHHHTFLQGAPAMFDCSVQSSFLPWGDSREWGFCPSQ